MDIDAILSRQPAVTCCGYSLGGGDRVVPGSRNGRFLTVAGLDNLPESF
jgi:hypothetical protein